MTRPDPFEAEILDAYEAGKLKSVATKVELNRMKAAARATGIHKYVSGRLEERQSGGVATAPKAKAPARRATS